MIDERKQVICELVKEIQEIEGAKRSLDERRIALAKRAADQLGQIVGGAVLETGLALLNTASTVETEIGDAEDWDWVDEIAEPDHVDELITVVPEESLGVDDNKPALSPKQSAIYEALKRYGWAYCSSISREFGNGASQHLRRLKAKGFAINDEFGVWRAV
jgi:hypothetical protein